MNTLIIISNVVPNIRKNTLIVDILTTTVIINCGAVLICGAVMMIIIDMPTVVDIYQTLVSGLPIALIGKQQHSI
jgi:hypothetical protein